MIEGKHGRSFVKKETRPENRTEPLYTVTTNSGNPVISRIQRNRRRTSTGIGSLSRMKSPAAAKAEIPESKMFDDEKDLFSVDKKTKINTYGKSKSSNVPRKITQSTGSLSDRLRLIDTTPTGEDPYQLGEAEMREQSPIQKLMLQKSSHGRSKISSERVTETVTSRTATETTAHSSIRASNRVKFDFYNLTDSRPHSPVPKIQLPTTSVAPQPDLNMVKNPGEIDWRIYNTNKGENEPSLCDFSYEDSSNLPSHMLPSLDSIELQELFSPDPPLNLDNFSVDFTEVTSIDLSDKTKKRNRTLSHAGPSLVPEEVVETKRGTTSKRGRKRAFSTTGLSKTRKGDTPQLVEKVAPEPTPSKPKPVKGKAACRGKKSPLPGMVTKTPYHTLVGDPDLSWYHGLDPDLKTEDIDQTAVQKVSSVEVPRWRENPCTVTSCSAEVTENLDNKVFEKRHQKLETEERRQLRWHMRRIREQRHVEKLKQRHRDSGFGASSSHQPPPVFTIWPQPQRDLRHIEITDTLPVTAFGESLPALPGSEFALPWMRTSKKALKRAKRSKSLH